MDPAPTQQALLLDALRCWSPLGFGRSDEARSAACLRYLPLTGWISGLIAALTYVVATMALAHPIAIALAVASSVMLAGRPLDRGAARWLPRALPPVLLIVRIESLVSLQSDWVGAALLGAATASRAVAAALAGPQEMPRMDRAIAAGIGMAPALIIALWSGLPEAAALSLAAATGSAWLARVLIGHPNNGRWQQRVGALQSIAETAFIVGLVAAVALGEEMPDETAADSPP